MSMARHRSVISHASEAESASDTLRCESAANEVTETVDDADDDAADEEAEADETDEDNDEAEEEVSVAAAESDIASEKVAAVGD